MVVGVIKKSKYVVFGVLKYTDFDFTIDITFKAKVLVGVKRGGVSVKVLIQFAAVFIGILFNFDIHTTKKEKCGLCFYLVQINIKLNDSNYF